MIDMIRDMMMGSRDGKVVIAFASHQCGPGSIPRLGVILWVEFVVGSCPCSEREVLWVLSFSPLLKNQHFKIPIQFGKCPQLVFCAKYIDT